MKENDIISLVKINGGNVIAEGIIGGIGFGPTLYDIVNQPESEMERLTNFIRYNLTK